MEFLGGIILGLIIGVAIPSIWFWMVLVRNINIEKATSAGLAKFRETVIPSIIEQVGDYLFLYNKETGEYIAQGKTFSELEINAKNRYPEKLFNVKQSEIDKHLKEAQ